jgi:hypothetical protein
LESYQLLTEQLLPKDPAHLLNQPTLRHPNLTPGSIFVSPETGRISCLIDWQHAMMQPLPLAAGYPRSFENPDSDRETTDFESDQEPKLDDDDDLVDLYVNEQMVMHDLHHHRLLFYMYYVFNGALNEPTSPRFAIRFSSGAGCLWSVQVGSGRVFS